MELTWVVVPVGLFLHQQTPDWVSQTVDSSEHRAHPETHGQEYNVNITFIAVNLFKCVLSPPSAWLNSFRSAAVSQLSSARNSVLSSELYWGAAVIDRLTGAVCYTDTVCVCVCDSLWRWSEI